MSMINQALHQLVQGEDLPGPVMRAVMDEIMTGESTPALTAAALTALAIKGETVEEITAAAQSMREHGTRVTHDRDVLEIVGTGGDKSFSFNISTTASFVIAAAGVPVAKHGNRSASSHCGAADCLEALGVRLNVDPQDNVRLLDDLNMCFFFAQRYHSAMKNVAPIRKEMGIRTIFNLLGPLTNPASATMQVLGVYREDLVRPLSDVLHNLGVRRSMVVYSQDGLDEITSSATNTVCECINGVVSEYEITPEQFGFTRCTMRDLVGGNPQENALITRQILAGEPGPKRDTVLMNAAAGIYLGTQDATLDDAVALAAEAIDSGRAQETMERFILRTQAARPARERTCTKNDNSGRHCCCNARTRGRTKK